MSGSKNGNEDWQRCRTCGTWWPVDRDFASIGRDVSLECPSCHGPAAYDPEVRGT